MNRRSVLASFAAAGSLGLLAACGDDSSGSPSAAGSATSGGSDGGAFPVTITHKFGDTVVESAPQRVAAVGFNEQDYLLALGVVPVGTRAYSGYDYDNRPWAKDLLPAGPLPVLGDLNGINLEATAAVTPDLIVGTYSYITDETQYQQLTDIAPTIGDLEGETEGSAATWQEELTTIGRAVGQEAKAQQLVTDVEGQFEKAREEHPEFDGKVITVVLAMTDGSYYGLDETDPRGNFFLQFGFTASDAVAEIAAENVSALDTDVLVVLGQTQADFTKAPTAAALPVVTEGRTVFVDSFDEDFAAALGFASPLSFPFAIEKAVPQLAAAADGDPSTTPQAL